MAATLQQMRYGQIAPNKSINAMIYRCFEYLPERTQGAFVRKFRQQPHDEDQVLHTFRELILGAFLASNGLIVRHEPAIGGRSPDWVVLDDGGRNRCVIEVTNFHVDRRTERAMNEVLESGRTWSGVIESPAMRLHSAIDEKASKYRRLADGHDIALVVGLFGHFFAGIEPDEVRQVLDGTDGALFRDRPYLSGVMLFVEDSGPYKFTNIQNPVALRPMNLPSGLFRGYATLRGRIACHGP